MPATFTRRAGLALAAILFFAACGGDDDDDATNGGTTTSASVDSSTTSNGNPPPTGGDDDDEVTLPWGPDPPLIPDHYGALSKASSADFDCETVEEEAPNEAFWDTVVEVCPRCEATPSGRRAA